MNQEKSIKLYNDYGPYILKVCPFREFIAKKGKGLILEDFDGNTYLDMMSGQFSLAFGHSYDKFNEILREQLDYIVHTNTLTLSEPVLKAAKELSSITANGLDKTLLLSTGAEAVECALRYAKFYTKREGIVSISSGYHGLTLATQSISIGGVYAKPLVPSTFHLPSPDWLYRPKGRCKEEFISDCLEQSRSILKKEKGKIAAFIFEPILSVGGMIFPPREYFKGLKEIAEEHDSLLILDECQTGLGRTGKWFGYEHIDIIPDILIFAKSAGLGFPTSGIVMNNTIAEDIENKIIHFSSHQNDPISGLALEFLIKHIKENNILEAVESKGKYFLKELIALSDEEPWIRNPRGLGLMLGFDLPFDEYSASRNPGEELISFLEDEGILIQAIRQGKTFRILPSYLISPEEINIFTAALRKCAGKL